MWKYMTANRMAFLTTEASVVIQKYSPLFYVLDGWKKECEFLAFLIQCEVPPTITPYSHPMQSFLSIASLVGHILLYCLLILFHKCAIRSSRCLASSFHFSYHCKITTITIVHTRLIKYNSYNTGGITR